jgi:hypothetical protein
LLYQGTDFGLFHGRQLLQRKRRRPQITFIEIGRIIKAQRPVSCAGVYEQPVSEFFFNAKSPRSEGAKGVV